MTLGKGHSYESLESIKEELNPKMVDIMPVDCTNRDTVPYLSTTQALHLKEAVYEDEKIVVEDSVLEVAGQEPTILRQLVFRANPMLPQARIPLIYRSSKSSDLTPSMQTVSALKPKKRQKVVAFDRDALALEHHQAMLAGICLVAETLSAKVKGGRQLSILVCGTGAGTFTTFIRHHFAKSLLKLVTVEQNEEVLKAAADHFGFRPDEDP